MPRFLQSMAVVIYGGRVVVLVLVDTRVVPLRGSVCIEWEH